MSNKIEVTPYSESGIKTVNIFGANKLPTVNRTRTGCRGIVILDGKMLVSHELNSDYFLIPGGGMEISETPAECCAREVLEETGYIVKPVRHFLTINEYYEDYLYIGYYFICEITGKGEQYLTREEATRGLVAEWIDINELIHIYEAYLHRDTVIEEKRGSYLRELTALKEYIGQCEEKPHGDV